MERLREYERVKMQELLRDFPHLRVGGLLPDPVPQEKEELCIQPLEWSAVVFPKYQGHGRKVIVLT